jgi:hypothetical protein
VVPTFPSPYISDWEQNPGNAFLTLSYTGTGSPLYRLEADLTRSDGTVIARATSPTRNIVQGPHTDIITGDAVWGWNVQAASSATVAEALRAGVIPEGTYELCIRAVSPDELQLAEACAVFTTMLPDAPELLSPLAAEQVTVDQPVFQWTPVQIPATLGPPTYRVTIAELYEHQTPATAIQSNAPIQEQEVVGATIAVYPTDGIPLEDGTEYVWQVTALDLQGQPLGPDDIQSPVWTFRKRAQVAVGGAESEEGEEGGEEATPDTITLIPGLARIVGASGTLVEPTLTGHRYEGTAWLELASPFRARMRVRMQGLETQGSGDNTVVTGGRAVADPSGSGLQLPSLPSDVEVEELDFDPASGLKATLRLTLGGGSLSMDGELDLTSAGAFGTVSVDGDGTPILTLGDGPAKLAVTRAELTVPNGGLELGGELELFGEGTGCGSATATLSGGVWQARLGCTTDTDLSVGGTGGGLGISFRTISGSFSYDMNAGAADYDLSLDARVRLTGPTGDVCTTAGTLALDGSGVRMEDARSGCLSARTVRLGWLELDIQDVRVDGLALTNGQLDPTLSLDLTPRIPALPDVPLPHLDDVAVSRAGIEVGSVEQPTLATDADAGGYGLRVTRLLTDGFTLDWGDWSAGRAGEMAFSLGASLLLPELADAPGCLGTVGGALDSLTLRDGTLTASLAGGQLAQPCELPLPGAGSDAARLSIEELSGTLALDLEAGPELLEAPAVGGALILGEPFACQGSPTRIPFPEGLGLRPDGEVEGTLTGLSPSCPITVAGVELWLEDAELAVEPDTPRVTLSGTGRARFSAAGQEINGSGSLTVELPDARVTAGRMTFSGPGFSYSYPSDDPLTSFTIGAATLSPAGLTIDGRYSLGSAQCQVPVTFDAFTVGFDGAIASGEVLFDAGASAEATIASGGGVEWAVSCAPLTDPLNTGARIELPAQVSLGPGGLNVSGTAAARLAYDGRDLASIVADFSGGFRITPDPPVVAGGRVDIREQTTPLGYFDRTGFHPNLGALARNLVPDRLPLPTEQVAYLQLRAGDGSLNVEVETRGDSVRLYTPGQGTAPLVLPALQLGRVDTPSMDVALDVWIDATGVEVLDGEIRAGVPAGQASSFDLSPAGVPLAIDSLIYADDGSGYAFQLAGRPVLPAELGTTSGQVRLTIERTGRMIGQVRVEETGDMDLIPSGAVRLSYDTVALDIDADLPNNQVTWAVDVAGDLAITPGSGQPYEVGASLRASPSGLAFTRLSVPQMGGFTYFDVGPVRLGIGDLQIPSISHDPATGWDFELWVDVSLEIPELDGYQLPAVEDVAIRPDSFTIPAFELPNLGQASPVTLAGFQLQPLAFRMDSLTFDLLGGSPPSDWGMGFDFELSLGQLPQGAPMELQNLTLSVLDASLGTGGFTGTIETRLPQPGIRFPVGGSGMEIELRELSGDLSVDNGSQDIAVDAEIAWTPPDLMICGTSDPTFDLTGNTLTLGGDGRIAGRINDLAQPCPVELGPLTLELTDADLIFAAGGSDQEASIDATGEARLPGSAAGDTISATGAIEMDLLAGRITDGSIAIDQPFRLAVPNEQPLFTFLVNQARLDTAGLTLSGGGDLRVGPNPAQASPSDVSVSFNSLTLGLPSFALESGTVTFNSAFALDAGIGSGGLQWAVSDTASQPPAQPGLRLTLPLNATLGAAGLEIGGSSGAALAFADSIYPLLTADFQQFRLGFDPARVDRGRVDLMLSNTRLAWVDSTGFNPDNVVAAMPIPERLGLPSEDVAYLQLRDSVTNDLLVGTSNESNGVRLRTQGQETVDLVVPSLQGQEPSPPVFQIALDILFEPGTGQVKAGTVQVAVPDTATQPVMDLNRFGFPMEVRQLAYADEGQGYALSLDARLQLPESLDSVRVDFEDLTLDANGLSGEAKLGSYRQGWTSSQGYVADATVGGLTLEVEGARAVFGQSPTFEMEGGLRMALFQGENAQEPARLPFTADVSTGGVTLTADPSQLPSSRLPLGVGSFEPTPVENRPAVSFTADASDAAVTLRGILRAETLSDQFAVTIDSLTVGTGGVSVPSISISSQSDLQVFNLFGAELTLKDIDGNDALALSVQNQVLELTMAGELDFLQRTAEFTGLTVATDGTVGMESAALVDESIVVVDSVLEITSIGVANGALTTDLGVTLPAPYADAPEQTLTFSVAPDGTVSGGGNVVVLDEPAGVSNAQVTSPLVHAHLRYLDAQIDLASQQNPGAIRMVGDLYLQGESQNLITVGDVSGNTVTPGLTIGFDGSLQWGSVGISQSFEFDFDVLAMTVNNAGVHQAGSDLQVQIGGDFAIDVPVVSGGIIFEKFRIGTDLKPDLSQFTVLQGNMTLANIFSISVNDFTYINRDTTLELTGGGLPQQAGDDIGTQQETVDVSSYVSFGGSVGIGPNCGNGNQCVFSGGVRLFQFYRTQAGDVSLVVDSAHFAVEDVVDIRADLQYTQSGDEFAIQLGAQADVMQTFGATMVGVMDNTGQELSAGLFLAVDAVMPVVPGIFYFQSVGGGFFLNGKQEHIDLVRSYVDVPDLSSDKFDTPVGKFTGLFFADMNLITPQHVRGRTLIVASNIGLQIDGIGAILTPPGTALTDAQLRGTMSLAMNYEHGFAEGNFDVIMDYSPIVDAHQEVGFYIYGEDAWGIYGNGEVNMVKIMTANSEFMIGPPGFYVGASAHTEFSFWIVDISANAEASVWRLHQPGEWGAYMSVMARADLGPLHGEGRLRGVLIQRGTALPYIYAGARARGCLGDKLCKSANVWAKFKRGTIDHGFGDDPDLNRAIGRAQEAKDRINGQAEELAESIEESRPQPGDVVIPDAMLAAAYQRFQEDTDAAVVMSDIRDREETYHLFYQEPSAESQHFTWYSAVLRGHGAPEVEVGNTQEPQSVQAMSDTVTARLQRLQSRQQGVYDRMNSIDLEFAELQAEAEAVWPTSPVRSVSLGPPQTTETVDQDGKVQKELQSGPTFDVDSTAANQAEEEMAQREQRTDQLQEEVWTRIREIHAGFDSLRAATADTAGAASPLEFASLHASALETAQMQYAYHGDVLMREREWLAARIGDLEGEETQIRNLIFDKTDALQSAQEFGPYTAPYVKNLARDRAQSLSDVLGSDSVINAFDQEAMLAQGNDDPWYAEQADSLGVRLWYDLAHVGMEEALQGIGPRIDSVRARRVDNLSALEDQHWDLTQDLHALYQEQTELAGILYDLYGRYEIWLAADTAGGSGPLTSTPQEPSGPQAVDAQAMSSPSRLEQTRQGRRRMATLLETPTFDRVNVTSITEGYLAREYFSWWGTHPSGENPYEFLYNSERGSIPVLATLGMQSNGAISARGQYLLAPDTLTEEENRTLRVSLRGGAGYLQTRRVEYVTKYGNTSDWASQNPIRNYGLTADSTPSTVWVADSTSLGSLTWSIAIDPESNMSEYEYAIARTGATAQGPSSCQFADTVRTWTSTGGRREAELIDLELTTDSAYWVLVRGYNASGLASDCGISKRLRYDATGPSFADTLVVTQPADTADHGMTPPSNSELDGIAQDVCSAGSTSGTVSGFGGQVQISGAMESFEDAVDLASDVRLEVATPTAVDPESGVEMYYWALSEQPISGQQNSSIWAEHDPTQTLRIEGDPLTYADSFYVAYVANNRAGVYGEPIVYGPFRPADPSPPVRPLICGEMGTDGRLRVKFESRGGDAETGRAGYRYRVRTAGGTVLRDWPSTDDLAPDSVSAGTVISTDSVGTSGGASYYVDVMIRNGRDMRTYTSTGPIEVDGSPPAAPTIQQAIPSPTSGGTRVELTGQFPDDPESGTEELRWLVIGSTQQGVQMGGSEDEELLGQGRVPLSMTGFTRVFIDLPDQLGMQQGQQYTLVVIPINGAGLEGRSDDVTFINP